jgi:hypothetical protein
VGLTKKSGPSGQPLRKLLFTEGAAVEALLAPTRAAPSVALSFSKFAALTKKKWRTQKVEDTNWQLRVIRD